MAWNGNAGRGVPQIDAIRDIRQYLYQMNLGTPSFSNALGSNRVIGISSFGFLLFLPLTLSLIRPGKVVKLTSIDVLD